MLLCLALSHPLFGWHYRHPFGYGYHEWRLPVFCNRELVLAPSSDPYSTPVVYTAEPLLNGSASSENLERIAGSASVTVEERGAGRIIYMVDNPNFRGFWYGTNRLFLNAVFFGSLIAVP